MQLLITGGAGFIGNCFVRHIANKYPEYTIVNLDKLTYAGNLSNLEDIQDKQNYHFVQGDICDSILVQEILSKYEINCIVNFAAESHVDNSIKNPDIFTQTNILGTQRLLDQVKLSKRDIKYLQVSTDEVYGSLGSTGYFTELSPIRPSSPYSASKASADLLALSYFHTFDIPVMITRCSNNYGPFQHTEKLIPCFINKALNNESLPVYGDGKNIRDWLYVYDHCEAIDLVLHKGTIGDVYNIGGNNEYNNLQITQLILDKLNKDKSLIKFVEDRLGHDRRYAINANKITSELNWQPKKTFETGIEETINWYINKLKIK